MNPSLWVTNEMICGAAWLMAVFGAQGIVSPTAGWSGY
jgi:hypothetical protein